MISYEHADHALTRAQQGKRELEEREPADRLTSWPRRRPHPQLRQSADAADQFSPDIVEIILDGRQPKGMQLEELTRAMPSEWEEQRKWLRAPDSSQANEFTGYWAG